MDGRMKNQTTKIYRDVNKLLKDIQVIIQDVAEEGDKALVKYTKK